MTFAGYVFDPDGTLYLGDGSLAGAGETPGELERPSGLVRLTDEPLEMPADYVAKLTRFGVPVRDTLLVGGWLATDIRVAREADMAGALVLNGATGPEEVLAPSERPDHAIGGLAELLPPAGSPGGGSGAAARALGGG
jgi:ribonucleotide monophosphatase NagD (HAD superfamily)